MDCPRCGTEIEMQIKTLPSDKEWVGIDVSCPSNDYTAYTLVSVKYLMELLTEI